MQKYDVIIDGTSKSYPWCVRYLGNAIAFVASMNDVEFFIQSHIVNSGV